MAEKEKLGGMFASPRPVRSLADTANGGRKEREESKSIRPLADLIQMFPLTHHASVFVDYDVTNRRDR